MVAMIAPCEREISACMRIVIDPRVSPAAVTGWKTTSDVTGVTFSPDGWSDPAHAESAPMPMVNNAMASVHTAMTKAFATAV